jgi:hypothetical protein
MLYEHYDYLRHYANKLKKIHISRNMNIRTIFELIDLKLLDRNRITESHSKVVITYKGLWSLYLYEHKHD